MKLILSGLLYLGLSLSLLAQSKGKLNEVLPRHTTYFQLNEEHEFTGEIKAILEKEIARHQFVGLAELHNSQQLGYFTKALMPLLAKADFEHMALEMGAFQVEALKHLGNKAKSLTEDIRQVNNHYGSRLLTISPLVFADRLEDAAFLEAARAHDLKLWGLDQEHLFSFEMHFDTLFDKASDKTAELALLYKKSKKQARKWSRKQVLKPRFKMACAMQADSVINAFLHLVDQCESSSAQIAAIRNSLDIYCRVESGQNSNQQRADWMKSRFNELMEMSDQSQPKVFLKFGSVHLTKGKSPYGVNDLGMHVQNRALENQSGFLNIRHLKRYRNGKDLIGKKGWRQSSNFMKMGKKSEWTLIDLRPIRTLLAESKLECTQKEVFEINSYDMIIVSPDDKVARKNF